MTLKSLNFRQHREKSWRELERLLDKIEQNGIKSLNPKEIIRLAKLYRTASSSLCMIRNISLDKNLNQYLERLVTRGYLNVYCSKPPENLVTQFFTQTFPQTTRKYFYYHFTAFLILISGIIIGFWATSNDSLYYHTFINEELAGDRHPQSSKEILEKYLAPQKNIKGLTQFSSMLFTHNSRVGFLCFSLGIMAGVPPIYLLFTNGGGLGAMSQVYHKNGLIVEWWAWILPHGITEFLAIILCAGAGIIMGLAIISPGKHGRIHQLKIRGQDAGVIVMGSVLLFFIAGLIEGYFRQLPFPITVRYLLASSTLFFWCWYFASVGKKIHEKA